MRKLISFLHTSLDGYVCGPNGEMDWIQIDDDIFDFAEEMTTHADMALYGRVTFEMMDAYWPTAADTPNPTKHEQVHSKWYNRVPKIVLSTTLQSGFQPNILVINKNIPAEINQLKRLDGENIIIFGSPTAGHSLMEHDLLDEIWLFVNPAILGSGTTVFTKQQQQKKLKLIGAKVFNCGVVGMHYAFLHPDNEMH